MDMNTVPFKYKVAIRLALRISTEMRLVGLYTTEQETLLFDRLTDALAALPDQDLLFLLPDLEEIS